MPLSHPRFKFFSFIQTSLDNSFFCTFLEYICLFKKKKKKGLSNHKYTHLSLDALMTPLSTISLSWSSRYMITFPPQLDMASWKEVPFVVIGAAHTYSYLCVCMRVCDSQLCLALCDCMDCSCQAPLCMGFSRQEYWSELPCLPPENLLNPGIKTRFPVLQADSLLSEPPGKLSYHYTLQHLHFSDTAFLLLSPSQ